MKTNLRAEEITVTGVKDSAETTEFLILIVTKLVHVRIGTG